MGVFTYRKTSHPKSVDDGQGWQETDINDTLNIFDNGESRTPTLICYENYSQDTRYREMGEISQSISATFGMGGNNQPFVVKEDDVDTVVRRLTPLECERLQGYPDGWTDIGEWTDSKGKKHKNADNPRYKALGNSIALPFWEWMAERICKLYNRKITMGSLFDGIGGFPLVFSRHGATPVWASEIEGFPIAVTKIRFPEEDQE